MCKLRKCKTGNGKTKYQHSGSISNQLDKKWGLPSDNQRIIYTDRKSNGNKREVGLILDKDKSKYVLGY